MSSQNVSDEGQDLIQDLCPNAKAMKGEEDPSDNNIEEYSDESDCHTHSKVSLIERHA
jgi:hypothetical protein